MFESISKDFQYLGTRVQYGRRELECARLQFGGHVLRGEVQWVQAAVRWGLEFSWISDFRMRGIVFLAQHSSMLTLASVHPSNVGSMSTQRMMYSFAVLAIWCSWLDSVTRLK